MTYKRDISHTLKLFVLGLVVFIGYQVWLKPAPPAPDPDQQSQSHALLPSSPPESALPPDQSNPSWDVPPSRLVELGSAPHRSLGVIRDEIEKGNFQEAERHLKALSKNRFTHTAMRRYIASLWNNLGVHQEKFGGTSLSVKAFAQSVSWDPQNALAHLNLTQAYWELRDPAMTPQFLDSVIRLAPDDPFPHLALADVLLDGGNAALAAVHVDHARLRVRNNPNDQLYLQKLTARIDTIDPAPLAADKPAVSPSPPSRIAQTTAPPAVRPVSTPAQPTEPPRPAIPAVEQPHTRRLGTDRFTVQFDGPADAAAWTRMRAILEYAHGDLSQKFGHVLSKPITVVLHTNQKFLDAAGTPHWADTLFDRATGRIHLPTIGALEDLGLFSRVARHQFAHALLLDYLQGNGANVPTWLIEGLAVHLAEDPWPDLEAVTPQAGTLLPLTSLEKEWTHLPKDAVAAAYREAQSATKTLIDRYSVYSIRQVINLLRTGQTLDAAMRNKLSLPYEQFQREWVQSGAASAREG
ncbi:MAG: hypothetical protein NW202_02350 [Nitrospira sp.]|nr:hypothetical protein [Nitrospira sp.]